MPRRNGGNKHYRTEWRVTSIHRPPRMEIFDLSFGPREEVHERLSAKLGFALSQLERNVLRHGENAEFSKAYFIGKN
ncbi:MAG: hypothetical protein UY41_C0019G0004 [Candidatus Moranbacteria bacterium GW2011_GWE1_49_15]|nr:MAG: hypothetical protein UX75_C0018G0008 [Candidatus Moranbacteria bacterium GW2011_GWE2_47_10]KKW06616.1 MAG: hypothetical protein UY41_C0019G0004 [Candidatus Moranbacteria bacterium GW2011_GWE1_49_15]